MSSHKFFRKLSKSLKVFLCVGVLVNLFPFQIVKAQPAGVTGAKVVSFKEISDCEAGTSSTTCTRISNGEYLSPFKQSRNIRVGELSLWIDEGWKMVFTPRISITSDRGFSREASGKSQNLGSPAFSDDVVLSMADLLTGLTINSQTAGEHFTAVVTLDGYYQKTDEYNPQTWPIGSGLAPGAGYDGPWTTSFYNGVPPVVPAPEISDFIVKVCYANGSCTTGYNVNPEPLSITYSAVVKNPSTQKLTSATLSLISSKNSSGRRIHTETKTVSNLAAGQSITVTFGTFSYDGSSDQLEVINGNLSGSYTYADGTAGNLPMSLVSFKIGSETMTCNPTGVNDCDLENCGSGHQCVESVSVPGLYVCSDEYTLACDTAVKNCSGAGGYGGVCMAGSMTCREDPIPAKDCDRCCIESVNPLDRCVEDRHGTCTTSCENSTIVTADCPNCCIGTVIPRPPLPFNLYQGPLITNLPDLLGPLAKILYYTGLLAGVLSIIYAGYLFITSAGEPRSLEEAKAYLSAGIFGLLFIILSVVIMRIVLKQIVGGNPGF